MRMERPPTRRLTCTPSRSRRSCPRPPTVPAASHPIPPAHTANGDVVAILTAGATQWLEILSHTGAVVAKTDDQPHPRMDGQRRPRRRVLEPERRRARADHVRRGPHARAGARRCERRRHRTGRHLVRVRDLRPVERPASLNRIVVVHPGGSAATIADRVRQSQPPTADAPEGWEYYLISWTSPGIAFARVPTGGCGCGSFDMQMQSAYSATINPVTEVVTPLTGQLVVPAERRRARHGRPRASARTPTAAPIGLRISQRRRRFATTSRCRAPTSAVMRSSRRPAPSSPT